MGSIFPMKEIDERINEIILHGGEKQAIALQVTFVKSLMASLMLYGPQFFVYWASHNNC